MSLEAFALKFLLGMSALLGVQAIPTHDPADWQVQKAWIEKGSAHVFRADSSAIVQRCKADPDSFVEFPQIIHGAHKLFLDGRLIEQMGDERFQETRSFYGVPVIKCNRLSEGNVLSWEVYGYSKYFSRFYQFPQVRSSLPVRNVFYETVNAIAAGSLIIMAFFVLVVFLGKVSNALTFSLALANVFLAMYFLGAVAGLFGLSIPMLPLHRFSDVSVWVGMGFMVNALRLEGVVTNKVYYPYLAIIAAASFTILSGGSGETIQLGTTIPFVPTVVVFILTAYRAAVRFRTTRSRKLYLLQFLGLTVYVSCGVNDIFAILGVLNSMTLFPIGVVGCLLFLALSVNERIIDAYRERDFLRAHLQSEVERKTSELQSALSALKNTQAELVQSAKLASLGTLSAGIAHEINNSLNYVNGSMAPLEKVILKCNDGPDKEKAKKLFVVMKDGLTLTLDIVKSLRSFTGLNQAKFNDLKLQDVAKSVLTILKNKVKDRVQVEVDIPSEITVFGSVVGLNQVIMNLADNAVDAMPNGGKLRISAERSGESVVIHVSDTGSGMPETVCARIFEPFYTTKEVGKGTGLGLHIVQKEIERHRGQIQVHSRLNEGTTFTITIPAGSVSSGIPQKEAA